MKRGDVVNKCACNPVGKAYGWAAVDRRDNPQMRAGGDGMMAICLSSSDQPMYT